MPGPGIETPQELDAAIAASKDAQRKRLERAVRNRIYRTRVGYGLSGVIAVLASVAFFVAHDREGAGVLAFMACWTFAFAFFAGKAALKNAEEALRAADQSL